MSIGTIAPKRDLSGKLCAYINLKFYGHPIKSVPAELITMLVINSQYENKKRIPSQSSEIVKLKCVGTPVKVNRTLGNNHIMLTDGEITVVIPCLELARTLFLQNFQLTRTAFRANGLQGMARADEGQDFSLIRFTRFADYPLKNLASQKACQHLIWLLFDPHAKRSFNSIYECFQKSTEPNWHFDFNPPPLNGWKLKLAGHYDEVDTSLFHVDEVKNIYNPHFGYPKTVQIYHPKKKEPISIPAVNGKRPEVATADPDPKLNLQAIPGVFRKKDIVTEEGFSFTFGGQMDAQVIPGKADKRVSPIVTHENEPKSDQSGVGHGNANGQAQELDWAINRDDVNEAKVAEELNTVEATPQFLLFEQAIDLLMKRPEYQHLETNCMALPKPYNGSRMYINKETGKPRTFHCAQLTYQQLPLMIVEVDLSDYPKTRRLSSQLFGFSGDDIATKFREVMQSTSDAGVHWDSEKIDELTCISKRLKHPAEYSKVNEKKHRKTEQEYLTSWVNNIDKGINLIAFAVL